MPLSFPDLSHVNRDRCEASSGFNHPLSAWSLSDWMTAACGELGEAANVVKKLNRVRDGIPGNSETPEQLRSALADEIADTVIYLDLLAQSEGIDLGQAIVRKFNRTSTKIGAPHRLLESYAIADAMLVARQKEPGALKMCSDCGLYPADPPSNLCPGCEAYKEHQA